MLCHDFYDKLIEFLGRRQLNLNHKRHKRKKSKLIIMSRKSFVKFIVFLSWGILLKECQCTSLVSDGLQRSHHSYPHLSLSRTVASSFDSSSESPQESLPRKPLDSSSSSRDSPSSSSSLSTHSSASCSLSQLSSLFEEDYVVREAVKVFFKRRGLDRTKLLFREITGQLSFEEKSIVNSIPTVMVQPPPPPVPAMIEEVADEEIPRQELSKTSSTDKAVKTNQVTDEDDEVNELNGVNNVNGKSDDEAEVKETGNRPPLDDVFEGGEFRGAINIPVNVNTDSTASSSRKNLLNNDMIVSIVYSAMSRFVWCSH